MDAESIELIGELAMVIDPDAFTDPVSELDDRPVERATAGLYAKRVAEWLVEHDRAVAERAVTGYQVQAGKALLALLPENPHRRADKEN